MKSLLEKKVLAGVGLLSMTREKAEKLMNDLSQQGEVEVNEAKGWTDLLVKRGEEERQTVRKLVREEVKKSMEELGFVTKEDFQQLVGKDSSQNKKAAPGQGKK